MTDAELKEHFDNHEELLVGIKKSKMYRNKILVETWKKEFSSDDFKLIVE